MLTLNLPKNQKVKLGDSLTMRVVDIDLPQRSVELQFTDDNGSYYRMLSQNTMYQAFENCVVVLLKTTLGHKEYATIGFDAPRHIRIDRI